MMIVDTVCYFAALEEYRAETHDERMPECLPLDTLSIILDRAKEIRSEKFAQEAELENLVMHEAAQL